MKGKKGGLGAFCYLAVFAMALLALPALLWFCRRGAGEEVTLPVVMYHRVCGQEEDADRYTVSAAGLETYGGSDSPYIWFRAPEGQDSWSFFDRLLSEARVVTTPGSGFGPSGEGFIRLTAFGDAERTREAVERIKSIL